MWVAIVGSRTLDECDCKLENGAHQPMEKFAEGGPACIKLTVWHLILESIARLTKRHDLEGIISGGARGVDTMAEEVARMGSLPVRVYRPESEKGRGFAARAYARNSRIVKQSDMVIAFFDPRHLKSAGTGDTVAKAIKAGKETHVWQGKWER